jgi:thiol-disulfide isomerase/thioredoxin
MNAKVWGLATLLAVGLAGFATAEGLGVGDPAPKLEVKEFVKGDAVKDFDKGKIYVVEFWATWCGPCRVSIPHLTELQKKNKDVVFIGVSVWEQDQSKVKPFVEQMGDKMEYRVAVDDVASGDKGNDGKMAKHWMTAAEQNGIPAAFIVNGDGKIAWIGHPLSMEKPLEQITSGKWDLQTAAADFKKAKVQEAKMREAFAKVQKALGSGDTKEVLTVLDSVFKDEPSLEAQLGMFKLQTMVKAGEKEKMVEYGNHFIDDVLKDDADKLNAFAWTLVEKPGDKTDPKLLQLGLKAAKRADDLVKGKRADIADTLAKAFFETGDAAKALETQDRAVKLAPGTQFEKDPGLKERLEQYKKAAQK